MKFENILYENHDGILYLTLNRPEVRNALSPEMWNEIRQAVSYAKADDAVKVVIISGAGDKARWPEAGRTACGERRLSR